MIAAKRDRTQEHSGVRRATGRDYDQWFALLHRWGAPGRPFREIADWLEAQHDVSQLVGTEADRRVRAGAGAAPTRRTARRHLHRRHQQNGGVPVNAPTTPSWIRRSANAGCPAP
jgi:hypothetical protein